MCRRVAVSEFTAWVTDIVCFQRWVCDLAMGRFCNHFTNCKMDFVTFNGGVFVAYQALYRTYRPQTFDDVVGQNTITQTLKNQLRTNRMSHAYLFTGTRGTGKTSCAKILAKAVNCTDLQNGNPCNTCPSCLSIDGGGCMDVLEIDAASNNGVDNVRGLRDDAIYTPSQVKKRVYIIDEVHMLSLSAFNALLKIIEEPPEHLLFILATTELHKVPATILSRCQRFSFRRLSNEDIAGRLNYVAFTEGIEVEQDALNLLARLADGALRDGLSLLDQCASATATNLTAEGVYTALGLAGDRKTAQMMGAIANSDTPTVLQLFTQLYAEGKDVAAMVDELCALSRDLLLLQTAPTQAASMLSGVCTSQELETLQSAFSGGQLLRMTQILQETASGFNRSSNRKLDAELCLMELSNPTMQMDAKSLNARLSKLENAVATGTFAVALPTTQAVAPADVPPPPWEDAPPPPPSTPAISSPMPSTPSPVGFVADFKAAVKAQTPPMIHGFLNSATIAQTDRGVELQVGEIFEKSMLDKAPFLEVMGQIASGLLGKPVMVSITVTGHQTGGNYEKLMDFSQKHSDIIVYKK